ncbi:pyocin S6 family toxin immunity protein [Pseudomonas izuensis]|uniref:pyocin S6 family toxin immunity protein n=1 Tax=Pseudomonas izuensis TaxID=2684212 RepID=UPI00135B354B|nr:pyocin S6 family toxin immunity protein [Pseudomonas izuensis]
MFLEITGFLAGKNEDDSIKFELDVSPEFEQAVMHILGWDSLAAEANGELPLTDGQVQQLEIAIQQSLPKELELFIGVRA